MNQDQFQNQLQMVFEANRPGFCRACNEDWFNLADFAQVAANSSDFVKSIPNSWRIVNYVREFENDRYIEATDFYYEMIGNVQGIDLDYAIEGVASAVFYFALYDRFADYWEMLKEGLAFPEFRPRA